MLRFARHPVDASKPTGEWTTETWYEAELDDRWTLALRLIPQGGRFVVGEARIFPTEEKRKHAGRWSAERLGSRAQVPAGGLGIETILGVRLGAHRAQAEAELEEFAAVHGRRWPDYGLFATEGLIGRQAFDVESDVGLARLAELYAEIVRDGNTRPARAIARQHGLSPARVRKLIERARQRGLLTAPPTPSRAGGELTPKGRELLGLK